MHQYLIVNDLARRVSLGVPRYFGVQRFHIVDAHHNAGSERIIVVGGGINDTHHSVWHGNGGTLAAAGIGWRHGSAAHLAVVVGTLIVGSGDQRDFGVQHIEERVFAFGLGATVLITVITARFYTMIARIRRILVVERIHEGFTRQHFAGTHRKTSTGQFIAGFFQLSGVDSHHVDILRHVPRASSLRGIHTV